MKRGWVAALAAFSGLGAACAPVVLGPRVTWVDTSTPGLKYVIVHPAYTPGIAYPAKQHADGSIVGQDAEYVLLCDGRGTGPMKCAVPAEVAASRFTSGPTATAGASVDIGVGVLGTKIEFTHRTVGGANSGRIVAPPPPTTTEAPPPPPPPPPPPAASSSAPTKEKKK